MNGTQKMLQAIINGQSTLKQELLSRIDKVDLKVDKLGKQLAYLEDDAPTREEFDDLEKRVDKIDHKVSPVL